MDSTAYRKIGRIMRITTVLVTLACIHVSARGLSQNITLLEKNAPLQKVLADIEKQAGVSFIYGQELVARGREVTVDIRNQPLEKVLQLVFKDQPLEYKLSEKYVVLSARVGVVGGEERKIDSGSRPATGEITGTVVDESGQPLAGATIKLKGGKIVGLSDEKGDFKLKNVSTNAVLEVSFTGYGVTEIQVNGKSALKISLKRANNKLDDVQVIAYGTTTERLNTGDVTTVTAKEIEEQPVSNPLAALEGRVPGLVINQTSGVPGGSFVVQIRGQNSLLNGNDPFYVIDGVPYSSQTVNIINQNLAGNPYLLGYNNSAGNPLNYINPSDIESISILKDADATSIYGSRAANGAILITTKKGKAGATKVDFNAYSGIGQITHLLHLMNTQQYLEMRNEAFKNDGATPDPTADFDLTFWDTTRYTNWQKVLIGNTAHYNDGQVSVSGGTENTQYLVGGGYHRETTVYPGAEADQKVSAHANINSSTPNKRFKMSFTASYVADMSNVTPNDLTPSVLLAPDAPALYNSDGTLNWDPLVPGQRGTWNNPVASLLQGYIGRTNNLVSNALISYTLLPGLNLSTNLGYTHTQTTEIITYPTTIYDPGFQITSGNSSFNTTNTGSWIIEPQATYSLGLGKGVFKALIGTTFHENTADGQTLTAGGFSSDDLLEDIQAATSVSVLSDINSVYKYEALFGRVSYNWQDKYLLNITARRDGSSRFGPASQFANFASVGAAWIFSKENFFQHNLNFLSFGKIRGSYGTSGNDQIGDYKFLDLYTPTQYPYQGTQGLYPANLFNSNLAWELDKKLEGAIDLGFLKDRIMIQASFYRNRSGNQLVTTPLSAVTGFSSVAANLPALVQNSGIELVLNTINIKSHDFKWSSSFNLTVPKNKLVSFPGLATSSYAYNYTIGKPITAIKSFILNGVNDSAGVYQYLSSKGTNTLNPRFGVDNTEFVNPASKFFGGVANSFYWNGFQLDILFQFVRQIGRNLFNFIPANPPGFENQNEPVDVLNRWQKPGDVKPYEQFTQSTSSNAYNSYTNYYSLDAYSDASFIRLKNVAFSYNIPQSWMHRIHMQNCRLYINGQNLLTITKYLGFDPETQGIALPPLRVLVAGVQFSL